MGAKDSKPSFISYEDAVKRVSDSELRRIREAFKRSAGTNGTSLSLEAFVHEVLCDGVPYEVAEWLYQACGGTKRGIAFRELLCGIVVLTKGNLEEKIKFLWTLYVNNQSDNGTYIYKRDFARSLHLENTSLPVTGAQRTAEILLSLFGPGEKVTFEQFRSWLLIHKDATVLSQWLLSGGGHVAQDLETPTFYQSLAGVTHLEERDIIELEKCFWSLRNAAPTGQLDAESLAPLLAPPLPRAAVAGAVLAFDENRDGHVDFKELCCGISAACRGPRTERLKFCFKIFDMDRDGVLNRKELVDMVEVLCTVANEALKLQGSRASTPDVDPEPYNGFDPEATLADLRNKLVALPREGRKPIFQLGPNGEGQEIIVNEQKAEAGDEMALTQEDFLIWSVESADALVAPFLQLLVELCHVVLGLRPHCAHQERDIVLGWLRREVQRGYSVGQFWYLVGAEWWGAWLAYTAGGDDACCRAAPRHVDEAIVCDESFTSNSTESMGSLLWRAETASVGSASSSGVSSAAANRPPTHPGPVHNKRLRAHNPLKVRSLTGEGGHLRRDVTLAQHRDFELVPDALWRALALWYGGPDPLPRQVIRPPNSDVELELYPLELKILRHVPSTQSAGAGPGAGAGAALGAGVGGGYPERQLAYTAAFSRLATVKQVTEFLCAALGLAREDVRLWALGANSVLLDDERPTLQELRLGDRPRLLLEKRNPDLTWPEEIGALSGSRASERRSTLVAPQLPGATGLHNLGNTCYMNAALQAVWNTEPLTQYFNSGMHLYEVNTTNPLGTRGALALRFGELCKEVWSCSARSVAPLRVRWVVSRHARALAGGGQHDAQELLAWLLDHLHEDLNRAPPPPPPPAPAPAPPAPDPAARPDQAAAAEAWEAYTARNRSILTELFYGQLKSRVRCDTCGRDSVRFDTFNMLSLPLPMESYVRTQIRVILLDGSVPVKYGIRVNSDETYYDLKQKLSELCGLPPESLMLVEAAGALLGRALPDAARLRAGGELAAYQLPPPLHLPHHRHADGWCEEAQQWAEVSVPRSGQANSLCMPALFCFKRSRSEIMMSQSPPGAFYARPPGGDTSPEHTRDPGSPTMSVKSLNLKPSSPCLKVKFGSSPSNMCEMDGKTDGLQTGKIHYLVAVHRKQCRADAYFLRWQRCRPALFGVPLLVGLRPGISGQDLYHDVWTQVARLLSPSPPAHDHSNHATDCDDSLGYSFPFTLRLVDAAGAWCGACAWPRLCRGCALPADARPLLLHCGGCAESRTPSAARGGGGAGGAQWRDAAAAGRRPGSARARDGPENEDDEEYEAGVVRCIDLSGDRRLQLAIDWDPTALHLRYQTTREKMCVEHSSVAECGATAAAVDLASCLRAFTSDERLEAAYHCAHCRSMQPATKKMQLWRAPPILVIHLKRFQYVNNKWTKSQKVVNFPFEDFDPTEFLAAVPQETILRHRELARPRPRTPISEAAAADDAEHVLHTKHDDRTHHKSGCANRSHESRRQRLQSTSLTTTPVTDDNLQDFHQHHLHPDQDPFHLQYDLYAVVSHSGQLSGGHYVAYARNPGGAWLCYNDSACRDLPRRDIDPAAAYLLFYQRRGLRSDRYLPEVSGPPPAVALEPDEQELARGCALM